MCWSNYMAIPIVLKKPLRVYKLGILTALGSFISLCRDFRYSKSQTIPTVKINPEFERCPYIFELQYELWIYDNFNIYEGYHSYLTKEIAKRRNRKNNNIGIFEIPAGATIYVNYRSGEVVSTDIEYLRLLKE